MLVHWYFPVCGLLMVVASIIIIASLFRRLLTHFLSPLVRYLSKQQEGPLSS